jgi:DNA-binding NarL/FixJ family response regulator
MVAKTRKTRVLIIDDHTLFRESVARLLQTEQDFEVRHCASATGGLTILADWIPEIVLLDFDLGSETGASFLAKMLDTGFTGKVLLLTAGVTELEAADLIRRGIAGIVLKQSSPAELAESIHEVLAGKVWFDQGYLKRIMEKVTTPDARLSSSSKALTERERQVLSFVFKGLANKEIADQLEVSESSVKSTLQLLFEKTGVRTRSQLVRIALEQYKDQL